MFILKRRYEALQYRMEHVEDYLRDTQRILAMWRERFDDLHKKYRREHKQLQLLKEENTELRRELGYETN